MSFFACALYVSFYSLTQSQGKNLSTLSSCTCIGAEEKGSEQYSHKPGSNVFRAPTLTDAKSELVAQWLKDGGGASFSLSLVLDALDDPNGLELLLQAASAVAASTLPKNERPSLFRNMGHIGEVSAQVSAYQKAASVPGMKHICEIGFNAGHSAITFLHMNPNHAQYTVFDIGQLWSPRAKEFVKYLFPGRVTYVQGDSVSQVKAFVAEVESGAREPCNLFSVDGDHGEVIPYQDFINARDATVDGGYILADDATTSFPGVGLAWEKAESEGWIRRLNCTGTIMNVNGYDKGWCYGRLWKTGPTLMLDSKPDVRRPHLTESKLEKLPESTINIAMSICGDRGYEALVSLKSAVLFMNSVSNYEFHLFTDGSLEVEGAFTKHVKAHQLLNDTKNVCYKFYSIDMRDEIQSLFRPCSANRLIIAEKLSRLSQFVYVDTDVIWLEDPANIFQEFAKFNQSQELGFAYEIENEAVDETSFYHRKNTHFQFLDRMGSTLELHFFASKIHSALVKNSCKSQLRTGRNWVWVIKMCSTCMGTPTLKRFLSWVASTTEGQTQNAKFIIEAYCTVIVLFFTVTLSNRSPSSTNIRSGSTR